jgi:hypothetical protein
MKIGFLFYALKTQIKNAPRYASLNEGDLVKHI